MSTDAVLFFIGADHHGHGIPADQTLDPPLHFLASWKRRLLPDGNRILVGGGGGKRKINASGPASVKLELLKKPSGSLGSATRKDVIERIQPLAGFQDFQSVVISRGLSRLLQLFQYWGLCQFCLLRAVNGNFSS